MQPIAKRLRYSSLSYPTRVWVAMLLVLTLCFGASVANAAASKPPVIVSQSLKVGDISSGGFTAQMSPAGGSFAVTPNGHIAVANTWGKSIDIFNLATGVRTNLAFGDNAGITSDSHNNLFVGGFYKHRLFKLPYVNGWAAPGNLDNLAACTGNDTTACYMPNLTPGDYNANKDFKNTAFDAAGNLYMVSATASSGTAGGNAIYVLPAGSLYTGVPTVVYQDEATRSILSIAFDPWGNLFFTDAAFAELQNSDATISSLNVLPYSSSTGYAATKTVLTTWTNAGHGQYDNVLSGVAVDPATGTVYYSDNNGIYAIPNTASAPAAIANAYLVSGKGGYQLMPDGNGNLFSVGPGNSVFHVFLNNVMVPASSVDTESQASAMTVLNGVDCNGTVSFALAGGNAKAASATSSTCAAISLGDAPNTIGGVSFATTVKLTPGAAGTSVATMKATDSANNTGRLTITGGQLFGPQSIVTSQVKLLGNITGGGFTAGGTPAGGSFAVNQQGNIALGTTYGGTVNLFDGATGAVTSFGEGGPAGLAVDSQNSLYQGTQYDTKVYKFPYVSGAYVTGATYNNCTGTDTQRCVVASLSGTLKFRAFAFDSVGDLFAVTEAPSSGGGNKIYKVAAANLYTAGTSELVFTDDSTHVIGSIALDPWGNLFFTDVVYQDQSKGQSLNSSVNVLPYSASTGFGPKIVLATYTNPTPITDYNNTLGGVNVDPATGTVYYSDTNTGTFAFVNNPSNFADVKHAYMVAAKGNYQIAADGKGNLWAVAYNNAVGKAGVYHISLNYVELPKTTAGAATEVTDIVTALSGVDCTGSVTFAADGGATASAVTTGTCATASLGVNAAVFPTTVSFTLPAAGVNVASLTATDSANNTGKLTITAFADAGTTPQTITFDNPGIQHVGVPLTVNATTSATGLTVNLTSTTTGVCTVSGTTATFVAAGTCTIEATQPGDDVYAAATKVTQSFDVQQQAQTITFDNPGTQRVGVPLTLVATSTSGLTVSLASTTAEVCTVSGTTATFVAPGTCSIEASQAGNVTYAVAPVVLQSFTVNGSAATPTFSPAAGTFTTNQTVTISYTTPGSVIYYTTNGTTPTINSAVYSGPIAVTVTTTIKALAVAPNYNDSAVATGVFTITPDFTFSTSTSSLDMAAGGSVTLTVSKIGGFNDAVWFACSGMPAGYTCSFSPEAVMPTASTTASTTLTVVGPRVFAATNHNYRPLLASLTLAFSMCLLGLNKRRRLQLVLVLALALTGIAMLTGCGGSKSTPANPHSGSTTVVTLIASSGALQHSTTFNLTVQ